MIEMYCESKIPKAASKLDDDRNLENKANEVLAGVAGYFEKYDCTGALAKIWELVKLANQYVDHQAPWNLAKQSNRERLNSVLYNSAEMVRIIGLLLFPFIPDSTKKILEQLGISIEDKMDFKKLAKWGILQAGTPVTKLPPLFPKHVS